MTQSCRWNRKAFFVFLLTGCSSPQLPSRPGRGRLCVRSSACLTGRRGSGRWARGSTSSGFQTRSDGSVPDTAPTFTGYFNGSTCVKGKLIPSKRLSYWNRLECLSFLGRWWLFLVWMVQTVLHMHTPDSAVPKMAPEEGAELPVWSSGFRSWCWHQDAAWSLGQSTRNILPTSGEKGSLVTGYRNRFKLSCTIYWSVFMSASKRSWYTVGLNNLRDCLQKMWHKNGLLCLNKNNTHLLCHPHFNLTNLKAKRSQKDENDIFISSYSCQKQNLRNLEVQRFCLLQKNQTRRPVEQIYRNTCTEHPYDHCRTRNMDLIYYFTYQ